MPRKNFPEAEQNIMQFWAENKIFEKTIEKDAPHGDYVFYDGPPFATGLPHYGHIIGSLLKDVVPRYWTMKGYRVRRKWGWDCHGLPIENIIEKDLNINSKKEIEELGVDVFNKACHSKVMMYADEWKKVIKRFGRFVDMENDYKTMDTNFMESVWWVFKTMYDKGLIYESYKSMHMCPRCETTLSQSEVTEGYKDIKDLSVVAKFELVENPGTFVLAWTTTPWTLPGNVALAFGTDIEYVKVSFEENNYILAKDLVEKVFGEKEYTVLEAVDLKSLIGKKYKPLFNYFENDASIKNIENAYQIIQADFVTTEDGTGIVHIAPGFGEDDLQVGKKFDLPVIKHVSENGLFTEKVTDFANQPVKPVENHQQADIEIIKYLAHNGLLFSKEKYEHRYPHCWRCDSPLLNYATNSWFINVTKLKPRMLELAKGINWVPEHIKEGRFGNWLEGARDWAISRQRYWGSVMPVWKCECGEEKVVGSIAELKELSGVEVDNLHKHVIDPIEIPCEKCEKKMKRIPDVLDCWFESGSMPFAQLHYPFENKEHCENNFPAQFIAEGADQTRCWFYYLLIISTAIMDKAPFENVIVNGTILAEDGKKMSKRLKNYPDPMYIMDKYGSDAMRLYLATTPAVKADDLNFSEKGVDEVFKKVMMLLWNVYSFWEMYADNELLEMDVQKNNILDQWILAKTDNLVSEVTQYMDAYDVLKSSRLFAEYVNELSTWYVRRSRDRFKSDDVNDKAAALQTLKEVMLVVAKVMAPFTPYIAEDLYLKLKDEHAPESVHLTNWPQAVVLDKKLSQEVLDQMQQLREIVEAALSLRSTNGLKIRQALGSLHVKGMEAKDEYVEILKDELNVKSVEFVSELPAEEKWLKKEEGNVSVALNSEITQELKLDGYARELVRHINILRKKKGLTIDDIIPVSFSTDSDDIKETIEKFAEYLKSNARISDIHAKDSLQDSEEIIIDGQSIKVVL